MRRGLSQAELGVELVSASYVSLIETGKRAPDGPLLQQLARRLGTSAEYLRTGYEAPAIASKRLSASHAELALASGEARRGFPAVS